MQYGFLGFALRQRLIQRWSIMYSVQPESVLEHTAIVGLLSILAGETAISMGKQIDMGKMLTHALLHDVAEVVVSDVITPVKKANANIHKEFIKLEKAAEEQLIQSVPNELRSALTKGFAPGGYEEQLVKACDTYSAYIKCKLEVAAGNINEFSSALNRMQHVIDKLKQEYPEIKALDDWFGKDLALSIDELLASVKI